jgi:hypothetical protein
MGLELFFSHPRKRAVRSLIATLGVALLAVGCSAQSGDAAGTSSSAIPAGNNSAGSSVQSTSVRIQSDGTLQTHTVWVTHEQMQKEIAARRAAQSPTTGAASESALKPATAIGVDGSCASADLWLYDLPNDGGNRLCLSGTGDIDLGNIQDFVTSCDGGSTCVITWAGRIRSYWGGTGSGEFYSGGANIEFFSAWQHELSVDATVLGARGIYQNQP